MQNDNSFEIQEKQQKVEIVKENFEREILKKIGTVLICEISKIIEKNKNDNDNYPKNFFKCSFPNYLKPIITLFNKDNLLIETATLYIFLNLNKLSLENGKKYNDNIQNILKIINECSEIKNLIITSTENIDNSQFFVEVQVPENLNLQISQLGEGSSYFLIYGVLAIIKWLGLLSPKYQPEYVKYEEYFQKNIQK